MIKIFPVNWNYFTKQNIMNQNGSIHPMARFDKNNCIKILQGMLMDDHPVIHYVSQDDRFGAQTKHTYKFFILNQCGHYNVSGLISASFGVNVNDRSSAFSINQLSHDDDIKAFRDSLSKILGINELALEDLITSAKDTLEFGISPEASQFLPLKDMPAPVKEGDGRNDPILLEHE